MDCEVEGDTSDTEKDSLPGTSFSAPRGVYLIMQLM